LHTKNRRWKVSGRVTISLEACKEERGKTLSEYFYDLIELGWERTKEEDVKQGSENEMGTVKQR
jgi:hypothetical protein